VTRDHAAPDARVAAAARALAGHRFRLLRHAPAPGAWNMAVDEVLLDAVATAQVPPTLRFYGWEPPALSLGRFQDSGEGIDLSLCRTNGWSVVRRPTGGRAVLHDREITFSIVVPLELVAHVGVLPSYCLFAKAMTTALTEVGVDPSLDVTAEDRSGGACGLRDSARLGTVRTASCFASTLAPDSQIGGRKLVGAAQVRRGGALLQHGSILLSVDRERLTDLFGTVGPVVALAELVPELPRREELVDLLAAGLAGALGIALEPGELTGSEADEVARRQAPKKRSGTRSPGSLAPLDSP
jgi:lipoate-protein ligase A